MFAVSFGVIVLMSLALAMDASVVSLAASTSGQITGPRATFRLTFHFGLFQGLMPVIGWLIGSAIEPVIAGFDHWIAFILLTFVAINMIRSAWESSPESRLCDPSRGASLVMLSIATSIDALAVGLSLKMLGVSIWLPALAIGMITALACLIAIQLGVRAGAWMEKQAQVAGGLVLILIGVRIVVTHTL